MDKDKKKAIMDAYKTRKVVGGVYCITCSGNNRKWLKSSLDLEGSQSRFIFAQKIKSCPEPSMLRECNEYGIESFSFDVLEELKKGETQTDKEFSDDIKALYEMWQEKIANEK